MLEICQMKQTRGGNMKINPAIIQQYAIQNNIKMKEARERLEKNYEEELNTVDFRQLVLRSIDGMRQISPKLNGVENRSADNNIRIRQLEKSLEEIINKMNEIIISFDNYKKKPWYKKLFK